MNYPEEILGADDDNGTMPANVSTLASHIVGHRIVGSHRKDSVTYITLDNGKQVKLKDTDDCCAYTALYSFLLHPELVDHVILGVGTTDEYQTWHIYADAGDVLELSVGWSCGNPFYYAYGFEIEVQEVQFPDGWTIIE